MHVVVQGVALLPPRQDQSRHELSLRCPYKLERSSIFSAVCSTTPSECMLHHPNCTCCCRVVARLRSRAACFRLRSAVRRSSLLAALPILASSSSTSVCKASLCFIKPLKAIWIGSRSVAKTAYACSRYETFGHRSPWACGKQRGQGGTDPGSVTCHIRGKDDRPVM